VKDEIARRKFLDLLRGSLYATAGLKLISCAPPRDSSNVQNDGYFGQATRVIKISSYQIVGLGQNLGTLSAQQIIAGAPVTMSPIREGSHSHDVVFGTQELTTLKSGGRLSNVISGTGSGHTHPIQLRAIPGSEVDLPEENPTQLNAALDEENHLYVASTDQLNDLSAEYCANTKAVCDSDVSLWTKMERVQLPGTQRHVLKSKTPINPQDGLDLNFRSRLLADNSKIVSFLKRLANK
jgi:hypothetical protein